MQHRLYITWYQPYIFKNVI